MSTPFMHRRIKFWPDGSVGGDETESVVTATGDEVVFTPAAPVNIVRWGFIVTTLLDVGAGATFAMDKRVTAGSDTGRVNGSTDANGVDTAGGTMTVTADKAVGTCIYHNVSPQFKVNPGEQAVIAVDNAADTGGDGIWFIEYEEEPFVATSLAAADDRLTNAEEITS